MTHDVAGRLVRWNGRKWPDRLHWQFDLAWLGEDSHGRWLAAPSGTVVRRGRRKPFNLPHGFVCVIPAGTWWEAEFYTSHPSLEVYVNFGTPCEWEGDRVRQVDLDLDVIRTTAGVVETIDEDEFADHQVRFGYPRELVDGARRAADEVAAMIEQRVEPFDQAPRRWIEMAERVPGPRPPSC